jgi:integrase
MKRKNKTPRAERWSVDGGEWQYRKPQVVAGKFRVRRRHKQTLELEMITLDSLNLTAAKREVIERADEERKALEEKRTNPAIVEPKDTTVGQALDEWMNTLDVRPATKNDYEASVALYKRALGSGRIVGEIQLAEIEALFFTLNSTDHRKGWTEADPAPSGEGWADRSGKTKVKHRMQLARFWKWAINHGYARTNVPEKIEIAKKWREQIRIANQTAGQALTHEEARELLAKCKETFVVKYERDHYGHDEKVEADLEPPPYLWLFVFISLKSGLRLSNVVPAGSKPGLTWGNLDLEEKMLRVPAELMKNGLPLNVPIAEELAEELLRHRKSLKRIPKADEPVIPEVGELKKSFAGALKRAGLGDRGFRLHDLRHTWASWAARYCTAAAKDRLGGWAASRIADRYSQHQEVEFLREELNKIPRLLEEEKRAEGRAKRQA